MYQIYKQRKMADNFNKFIELASGMTDTMADAIVGHNAVLLKHFPEDFDHENNQ